MFCLLTATGSNGSKPNQKQLITQKIRTRPENAEKTGPGYDLDNL
jgi:hypothetical protein